MTISGDAQPTGYLHPRYAGSFSEYGTPRFLSNCRGWILERAIPGERSRDAMGCYPLFACDDWSRLSLDIPALSESLVALSLVTDPFGNFDDEGLRECFDLVRPYKQHYVADLAQSIEASLPRNHRRNLAKALSQVEVECPLDPSKHLEEWLNLFSFLVERHRITGMRALSRRALSHQLRVPGLVMFRATAGQRVVGMHLWFVQGDVAYGHLGAVDPRGYHLRAWFALYAYAVAHFRDQGVRWLDLGGAPDASANGEESGLGRFKQGWSTGTRPVYLCGRILQPERYAELVRDRRAEETSYFPAYRDGELSTRVSEAEVGAATSDVSFALQQPASRRATPS